MIVADQREILVVEDNRGDALLAREAFREAGAEADLNVVTDGAQAIAYLRGEPPFEDSRRPDLILLDLKLPVKDGHEVLREVKSDPFLRGIPIVVLTTSAAEHDVREAYELHANSYLRKPVTFDEFVRLARTIADFWLDAAHLPPN
jgi:CheY-like chemotaxis protein